MQLPVVDELEDGKLFSLKRKLAAIYATTLLAPPENQSPLLTIRKSDTVEERKKKKDTVTLDNFIEDEFSE